MYSFQKKYIYFFILLEEYYVKILYSSQLNAELLVVGKQISKTLYTQRSSHYTLDNSLFYLYIAESSHLLDF